MYLYETSANYLHTDPLNTTRFRDVSFLDTRKNVYDSLALLE